MVAGLAGQSVEAQRGNGTHQAAFGLCVPNGQGYADSADGYRAATGYALYRGYAQETRPPLSQKAVHLDHGRGPSVAIPPLETMARHRAIDADCSHRPARLRPESSREGKECVRQGRS